MEQELARAEGRSISVLRFMLDRGLLDRCLLDRGLLDRGLLDRPE